MESNFPCYALISHSLKWRYCSLVWPISHLTKASFDPLGRDQSSFRLPALLSQTQLLCHGKELVYRLGSHVQPWVAIWVAILVAISTDNPKSNSKIRPCNLILVADNESPSIHCNKAYLLLSTRYLNLCYDFIYSSVQRTYLRTHTVY